VDRSGNDVRQSLDVRFTPFYPRGSSSTPPTPSPTVAANPTANPSATPTAGPTPEQTSSPTSSGNAETNVEVIVNIVFDAFQHETGWSIIAMDGTTIISVPTGTYALPQTEAFQSVILLAGTMYNFTLIDFFEDGMSGGSWEIVQNDVTLASGSGTGFTSSVTVPFTTGVPPGTPTMTTPTASPTGTIITTVSPTNPTNPPVATTASPTATPSSVVTPAPVPAVDVEVTFELIFDGFPDETSWSLTSATGEEIDSSPAGGYDVPTEDLNNVYQLKAGASYVFVMRDRAGDGLCCPAGRFSLTQDGVELVSGEGNFGLDASFPFATLGVVADATTSAPAATIIASPTATPSSVVATLSPTVGATTSSPTPAPVPAVLHPVSVDADGLVDVTFELIFDSFPEETSWSLTAVTGEEIDSSPAEGYTVITDDLKNVYQLEAGASYVFVIQDRNGDGLSSGGFSLTQEGFELVSGGGNFGQEGSFPFIALGAESSDGQTTTVTSAPADGTIAPTATIESVNVTVLILFDDFPAEIGWSITQNSTSEEIISVPIGTYPLLTETGTEIVSLIPGEVYEFTIEDFFGDGLTARGQDTVGSYMVLQDVEGGTITLVTGEPAFGFNESTFFSPVFD
jgi:uncharacterized protein (DUF2141 family)